MSKLTEKERQALDNACARLRETNMGTRIGNLEDFVDINILKTDAETVSTAINELFDKWANPLLNITIPPPGFFTLAGDAEGNLWCFCNDETNPPVFEHDDETGNLYLCIANGEGANGYKVHVGNYIAVKHLDDYYTKTVVDGKLAGKSDTGHNHDSRYYTESEVNTKLASKSDTGHAHDERYYTETEMNTKLEGKSDTGHNHNTSYYTRSEVDALVEQSSAGNNQSYTVIPYGADLNDYKTPGLYITEEFTSSNVYISEIENCPTRGDFLLEVYAVTDEEGNKGVHQILHTHKQIAMNSFVTETHERIYIQDGWNEWYRNYNSYNFNPSDYYKKTETDNLLAGKASNSLASTSANGLMSSTDKGKLDGVATGANKTVVDSSMSSSSTNPVQNKIIYRELSNKANTSHTHTSLKQTFIPANADLNNYKTPGIYTDESWYDISSMKNVPLGWSFILEVKTTEGDLVLQTFTAIGSSNLRKLERIYHRSNGWSEWYEYTLTPLGGG